MNWHSTVIATAALLCTDILTVRITAAELGMDAPVIEMQFVVPQTGYPVRAEERRSPELQIFPDGMVRVQAGERDASARLSSQQLDSLMRELLTEYGLGELSSEQIRNDVQAEGLRLRLSSSIPSADDTVIRIRAQDRYIELRCHATGLMATRFPEVRSLQRMLAAQERLQNIRALVLLGDGRQAQALARQASESLQAQMPGSLPLTARELSMVHTLPDGTRLVQFCRRDRLASSSAPQLVVVSLMETPGEQPRVTVMTGDTVLR